MSPPWSLSPHVQSLLASSSSDNSVKLWRAVIGSDAAGARGRLELVQALSGHLEAVTTLLQLRLANDDGDKALASDADAKVSCDPIHRYRRSLLFRANPFLTILLTIVGLSLRCHMITFLTI